MANNQEVALFVDYENVIYAAIDSKLQVPTPSELMKKASKYGRVIIARAFADFNEELIGEYGDKLITASIEKIHCPSENHGDKASKHYTDFQMLDNIYQTTYTNPDISVYVLVTGDGHFSPVAAFLKHRLQKEVVIAGPVGQTHRKLQESGSTVDLLEMRAGRRFTDSEIRSLIQFVAGAELKEKIVTLTTTARHFQVSDMDEAARRIEIKRLVDEGKFIQQVESLDGKGIRRMYLNHDHPVVKDVLGEDKATAS